MNLDGISFGDRVAENESGTLTNYFIETEPWSALYSGSADVVFGSKGSGKSALYTLLLNKSEEFLLKGIVLVTAENPTGKTVFSDITSEPPTSENEFVTLWKIYFCQLIVNWLIENNICNGVARDVSNSLVEAGLIQEQNTLRRLVNSAKTFAKNLINLDSLEGGLTIEGGVTGKITFRTPSVELQKQGYKSVDELLSLLNQYLQGINKAFWVLCDRLDVAFDETLDLEKNALRALFKAYRDIEEYKSIRIKIFLRDDIWRRITKEGFREASHITRSTSISWTDKNLLNLIVMRILENNSICQEYQIDTQSIRSDYEKQTELYYKIFPKQVDIGEKQSETFNWILSRVRDGLSNVAPRELIHFYNEIIIQEKREQSISNNNIESPNLVSRQSVKNATQEVSKVRTEQTVFAESPDLKESIMALENGKAEHNLNTLCSAWSLNSEESLIKAQKLAEIGFFEQIAARTEKIYKIPFLYRSYLRISQGKAYQ